MVDLPLVRVRQKDPEVLGLVEPKQLVRGFVLRMIFWVEGAESKKLFAIHGFIGWFHRDITVRIRRGGQRSTSIRVALGPPAVACIRKLDDMPRAWISGLFA